MSGIKKKGVKGKRVKRLGEKGKREKRQKGKNLSFFLPPVLPARLQRNNR
jgi:hypothetical protein